MIDQLAQRTLGLPAVMQQLDNQFVAVDLLPESLLSSVITHSGGNLDNRCYAISTFRNNLLAGNELQSPCPWLPEQVQQRILERIEEAGVARYCYQSEEVTDALILDLLSRIEGRQQRLTGLVSQLVLQQELDELEKLRLSIEQQSNKKRKKGNAKLFLTDGKKASIQAQAELSAWFQLLDEQGTEILPDIWAERLAVWEELESVFTDLGIVSGLGFDLSKGVFQSHGWMNIVRLHKVIKTLPQLRDVIQTIGRLKDVDGKPIIEEIVTQMSVMSRANKDVVTPLVPMETKGVTRSDSISRMLPQETALLTHPVLKKLWHAKRAEHALLSYAVEGTDTVTEELKEELEVREARTGTNVNKNSGPIIVCLDTSGSMMGTPENVAKALVLECLSVATRENRQCYVYLFGSSGEIEERELSLTKDGLERMISFLSMSFGGGTDAEGPLNLALARSDEKEWDKADILIVSDGEFAVTAGLSRKINNRKERKALAVHGVLIGNDRNAMEKICDPLHQFSDWLELQSNSIKR